MARDGTLDYSFKFIIQRLVSVYDARVLSSESLLVIYLVYADIDRPLRLEGAWGGSGRWMSLWETLF